MDDALPIEAIRANLERALRSAPVVVTAPTGSGKSTQVPRWCAGPVVVVEPRRVACKTLAARVAELEGCELGTKVGFHVRDHRVEERRGGTRILFVTPGIALRRLREILEYPTFIIDEFHERTLELDLILALLRDRYRGRGQLAVMSATLQAERVAAYLDGTVITAAGRQYPVATSYVPSGTLLPELRGLEARVLQALQLAREAQGDVLVFLPGKGEIRAVAEALSGAAETVIPLHGELSLADQSRAFRAAGRRKIVLATNVAETSVTVPGISVVIDSGLVRRTRYHRGRGFLTLMPIGMDSAEQRAGRAGRTGPGICYRLWSEAARLEPGTPPEIQREALLPLTLAAAACDAHVERLTFLDAPADYAVEAAQADGQALGALDERGRISALGRELFGLPLDPPLGRLLVEARKRNALADAIDLVAVLAVGRPLFRFAPRPGDDGDELRAAGCDATACIHAMRRGRPDRDGLHHHTLQEARGHARRLRRAFGLRAKPDPDQQIDRQGLVRTALAADPRCAHVARHRRGRVRWSNGGTEIELGRESAANVAEHPEALVVFETRALGKGWRQKRIVATSATPVPLGWLAQAGLGRERVARVMVRGGRLVAKVERVFAKKVIAQRDREPQGHLAREAIVRLVVAGELLPEVLATARLRLRDGALAARLAAAGRLGELTLDPAALPKQALEEWLLHRLDELGLESPEDVELLAAADLIPAELPAEVQAVLGREFPREICTADARYVVTYDLDVPEVTLTYAEGHRGRTPALSSLPRFAGFRIRVDTGRGSCVLRERSS